MLLSCFYYLCSSSNIMVILLVNLVFCDGAFHGSINGVSLFARVSGVGAVT